MYENPFAFEKTALDALSRTAVTLVVPVTVVASAASIHILNPVMSEGVKVELFRTM
jgi:hypothetical protein